MPETEDKEKAEKLAAAKKRFEQLKKQQQKGKKPASKKKDEKREEKSEADEDATKNDAAKEAGPSDVDASGVGEDVAQDSSIKPPHGRQPSVSLQSKLRSDSFRRTSGQGPLSPTSPLSPGDTARLGELGEENKRLQAEVERLESSWRKTEEELEDLREANVDLADLKGKASRADEQASELEKLRTEIASLQRQNAQLQSMASKPRRISTSSPANSDVSAALASKSAAVESLELEVSNLNTQLTAAKNTSTSQADRISALEDSLSRSELAASSAKAELADLKQNLERASAREAEEGSERSSVVTRIAQLEAEAGAAKRALENAEARATALAKKIEALTTLHREAEARTATKDRDSERNIREAHELRTRIGILENENARLQEAAQRRQKQHIDASGDGEGVDELENEALLRAQARIRELEEETFELRRGVWRDRRRDLQPGLEDDGTAAAGSSSPGFDDVDLSAPTGSGRRPGGASQRTVSSFQDVLTSGLSAITGGGGGGSSIGSARRTSSARDRPRKQSLGLLSEDEEDFAFDEATFRAAQEEEARKRVERVREVKRGLTAFRGWRVDLVEDRGGMGPASGVRMGPVFEV